MLKNYMLIFWRNIMRNKVYAAINIFGLATGIASCILIYLYVQHELSYDQNFKHADRLYRITSQVNFNGQEKHTALSHGQLSTILSEEYPEVESATYLIKQLRNALRSENKALMVDVYYADSNFFKVLPYPFVAGDPATALRHPHAVVITDELARKYYGSAQAALGKSLTYIASSFLVTGVITNPQPSHLKLEAVFPLHYDEYTEYMVNQWVVPMGYTYLKLHDTKQVAALQAKFPDLHARKVAPNQKDDGISVLAYNLQPITDAYLDKHAEYSVGEVGNITNVYIFGVIALFILLIAAINYINLATARAAKRSKEVGLRKTIGASRGQLVKQFLTESLLLTLLATVLGLAMVELILPLFNALTERNIETFFILRPEVALLVLGIVLFVGLAAGSYPAFYLSHFNPTEAIKANALPKGSHALLRKSLVVLQFTVSLVLIIATLIVDNQMQHMQRISLGFNKDQVIAVTIPSIGWVKQKEKLALLKQEMRGLPQVTHTSSSQELPGEAPIVSDFQIETHHKFVNRTINSIGVDYTFLDLMDIALVDGRNFSKDFRTDVSHRYLINEAAAREFGWTHPLDKRIKMAGDSLTGKVIGVVKDFHYKSLHSQIEPLILRLDPHFGKLLVRVQTDEALPLTLQNMERVWKKHFPEFTMEYVFLDDRFNEQYRAEEKMLTIFSYFTALTIIIACLGLFGLAAFTAEQRTKEIGIRKVMGSSVTDIVLLLSKDFAVLVLIAAVIASPLAWYGMEKWLQDFAYRTELRWSLFGLAGLAAMAMAILTVSYQALKAATIDPVQALRTE